jgi:hypothetical protein
MAQTYITLENLTRYNTNVKATYATIADVSDKDTKVVHLDGEETITGLKTFARAIVGDLTGTSDKAIADGDGLVIKDTYATKEEVSKIITAEIIVLNDISELPVDPTAKDKKTIFLVGNGSDEEQNVYDEYVWASTGTWEKIGTTKVDLSNYVTIDGVQTITGVKTFAENIIGNLTGNADTATKLETSRTINGTSFDGSADITTETWGTARTITIADADNTNSATGVSVDGSADITFNLPGTIKASLDGTAAMATADADGNVISETYMKNADVGVATDEEIDALFA